MSAGVKQGVRDFVADKRNTGSYDVQAAQDAHVIPPWMVETGGPVLLGIVGGLCGITFCTALFADSSLYTPLCTISFGIAYIISSSVTCVILRAFRTIMNMKYVVGGQLYDEQTKWGHPILGITKKWHHDQRHRKLDYLYYDLMGEEKTVRAMFAIFLLNPVNFFTTDPKNIKHILRDKHSNYIKSDVCGSPREFPVYGLKKLLGEGIFAIDHGPSAVDEGRSWSQQRKIAAGIFTKKQFQTHMGDVFVEKARTVCDVLDAVAEAGATIDLQSLFGAFTLDSICDIAFAEDDRTIESFAPKGSRMAQEAAARSNEESIGKIGLAFDQAHDAWHNVVPTGFFWVFFLRTLRPFHLSQLGTRLFEAFHPAPIKYNTQIAKLDALVYALIGRRRQDPNLAHANDLLAQFIRAETVERTTLPDSLLRDVILSFLVAGKDTTAALLSWTFYELGRNPHVLKKLHEEIETLIGPDNGDDSLLTYEFLLHKMPYLRGVIYESLRLHPPVPLDFKVAAEDDILPDGRIVLKGWRVSFFPWGMGRDSSLWENPLSFNPERWIPFKQPDPYKFPVFQGGPRICVGMNMALFEASLLAVAILRRFEFQLTPEHSGTKKYKTGLTMRIADGLEATLSLRTTK
eukprot:m.244939 g.244939  ORF g.244939 m.244939 type:complete len:630 (-) comp16106_c0_seq26:4782-6671(-)